MIVRWLRFLLCALLVSTALPSRAAGPQRIVSLLPSLTESVCALGACERLVGVDRFSNWPESVLALPKAGGLDDAQVERIIALKPDLVLAAPSARVVERLQALGLNVQVLRSDTHEDVRHSLIELERLLQLPGRAEPLWRGIQARIDAAAARVPRSYRGARVYFEIDSAGYAAGEASFIGETLTRLGLANAVPAALGAFPKLNPEWVPRHPPDLVMAVDRDVAAMPQRPGWRQLPALRQGRHCGFPYARYELLIRPGPRLGEAAELLAECLQRLPARNPKSP